MTSSSTRFEHSPHGSIKGSLPVIKEQGNESTPPSLPTSSVILHEDYASFSSISLSSLDPLQAKSSNKNPFENVHNEEKKDDHDGSCPVPFVHHTNCDSDLSFAGSSREIEGLELKLRVQEQIKMKLLAQLQKKSSLASYVGLLKKENKKLKEAKAKMELEFKNDMQRLVSKMIRMSKELDERDEEIEYLQIELNLSREALDT